MCKNLVKGNNMTTLNKDKDWNTECHLLDFLFPVQILASRLGWKYSLIYYKFHSFVCVHLGLITDCFGCIMILYIITCAQFVRSKHVLAL